MAFLSIMSSPFALQLFIGILLIHMLLIFLISPVKCRLAQLGCLSYPEKTNIQSVSNASLSNISAGTPEWCDGPVALTSDLRTRTAEASKPPFVIRCSTYAMSNSLLVRVRKRNKQDTTNFIGDIIIQARPVLNGSNPPLVNFSRSVGRFYITPKDIQLGCCRLYDRNIARVNRFDSLNKRNTKSVTFIWLPNGFLEDYEGPVMFVATISNTISQYWTQVTSRVQTAHPRVDFTEDTAGSDGDSGANG